MNVIQPRSRNESKEQAAEIMQDAMLSSQGSQPSSAIHHHRKCYKCGQKGHYAKGCPQKRLSPAPRQAGQQGRPAQPRTPAQGRVNHVTAESAAKAPNVVMGTFMVNSHPATVLFDTSATHSFITKSYVEEFLYHCIKEVSASLFTGRGVEIPYYLPPSQCSHKGGNVQC